MNSTIDDRLLRFLPYTRRPCPFFPGSPEKIAVLALRAALRLPLHLAGDRCDSYARGSRSFARGR